MKLKGIPASSGISIAKVFKIEEVSFDIEKHSSKPSEEVEKFDNGIKLSVEQLIRIKEITEKKIDKEHAEIFNAHIMLVNDPEIKKAVVEKIKNEEVNAEYAYNEISNTYIDLFESMDNEYMRERASDLKDIKKRIISNILNIKIADLSLINEEVIIVAKDLTPSETTQLDKKYVKGFITEIGGKTSHSAIMARTLEIPAVVGTTEITKQTNEGDIIVLNGITGQVIINPSNNEVEEANILIEKYNKQKDIWEELKDKPSISKDGHKVEIAANIGNSKDAVQALEFGAEGVGLFRTEFLYMESEDFPTEDQQYNIYSEVLDKMSGKGVVVRTLDIGGDKHLPYLDMPKELNPFLGYRAIRLCLDRKELFRTQLRALLRANKNGNLKIMFPMIATIDEFIEAKGLLLEEKDKLINEGYNINENFEVGMMVEIPAAAILADQFAKVVDFFSIGTNDLIQYTFAADRMNETVSYLYQPYNPSLLRLIDNVIKAAHKEGRWAGMCGEVASDEKAIPLLLGMGLDEFSMSATSILSSRYLISKLDKKECKELVMKALTLRNNKEVYDLVDEYLRRDNNG